jgi:hypothetical protein
MLFIRLQKKKGSREHSTAANPPPKAHTQKPNGGGYAAVQTFRESKRKSIVVKTNINH